jgi:hypothetical protein
VIKPEWGTKHQCPKCGTRFYDLKQVPEGDLQVMEEVTCISCENVWRPEFILKSKQSLPFEQQKEETPEVVADDAAEVVDDLDADDIGDDSTGDVSLDDDDADIEDVVDPNSIED